MAKPLLPDELWELIRPLIPPHPPQPKGGRPPLDDRKVLTGLIFILKTGIPWEDLPQEMGCGCGMTCWNRLRDWQAAGVWDEIHQILLAHLRHADQIDFERFFNGGLPSPPDALRTRLQTQIRNLRTLTLPAHSAGANVYPDRTRMREVMRKYFQAQLPR